MNKKILLACMLLFLLSISAAAQTTKSYIGPHIGWQKASDADAGKVLFGGLYRIKLSSAFGLEASVDYRKQEYNNGSLTVKEWPVMISGLIYPFEGVYGEIGLGWYNSKADYSAELNNQGISDKTDQKLGWHFGAGLELPLGNRDNPGAIITADFKYTFLNYDFEKVPGSDDIKSDYFMLTAGLLFALN